MRRLHWVYVVAVVGAFLGAGVESRGATPGKLSNDSPVRTWTDSTGRFHTQGILLGTDQSSVRLQKTTGSVVTVALARLSAPDRQFVLSSRKSAAAPTDSKSTQPISDNTPAWWDGLQAG